MGKKEQQGAYKVEITSARGTGGRQNYAQHTIYVENAKDSKDALNQASKSIAPAATIVKVTIIFLGVLEAVANWGSIPPFVLALVGIFVVYKIIKWMFS